MSWKIQNFSPENKSAELLKADVQTEEEVFKDVQIFLKGNEKKLSNDKIKFRVRKHLNEY